MSVLVFGVSMLLAQGQSIATLNHDGEVQVFYGTNALSYAHSAATHGDVITLSSGTFSAITITKELTIRGAGMQADSLTNALPTYISGSLMLKIDTNTVYDLTLEGLNIGYLLLNNSVGSIDIYDPKFIKCKIGNMQSEEETYARNGSTYRYLPAILRNSLFINCDIYIFPRSSVSSTTYNEYHSITFYDAEFINCRIRRFGNECRLSSGINYGDAIIVNSTIDEITDYSKVSLINCIIKGGEKPYTSTTCYAYMYNCLTSFSDNTGFTEVSNCYTVSSFDGIFEDEETGELTEEAKAKYIGNDNTEVGMYGGAMPFDPKTTAPQITKCNVATKSTADGKLSVDIEVKVAE